MKFLLLAALPALVAAQYGAPPDSGPASSSTSSAVAAAATPSGPIVTVGTSTTPLFSPQVINATAGTNVTFMFTEVNGQIMHSVTQSTFANPCTMAPGGFASGFQPAGSVWTITVNTSSPIWFFCTQFTPLKHCNLGMVGAINPPPSGANIMANFIAAATSATDPLNNASNVLTGVGAFATAPAGIPSTSASAPASSSSSGAGKLIAGASSLLAGVFTLVYTLA